MDARACARWTAPTVGAAIVFALAAVGSATSGTSRSLAAPGAVLDATNPARPSACRYVAWVPDSANEWVAETFTAGLTGSLTDVILWLRVSNPQNPVGIAAVDAEGRPDVTRTLASATLAVGGSTTFNPVGVSFPVPARVEAGKQYALVLHAPVRDAWAWQADLGSSLVDPGGKPCADGANTGGRLWLSSDPMGRDADFFFQTYVVPARRLTVQKTGTGTGVVKDETRAIDCGASCAGEVTQGQTATLTATPDPGSIFAGWSGAGCEGSAPTCTVTVGGDVVVTAAFTRRLVTLTVSKVGRGTVTSVPAGITCGRVCSRTSVPGAVKLTAKPLKGWRFARWKGACRGTKPVCRLTLAATGSVAAVFRRA